MKKSFKPILFVCLWGGITGCTSSSHHWKPLNASDIDQKSYAIAYAGTAQTYEGRVSATYDIEAYIRGVDDYFNHRSKLPVEQVRGSLMNRMLDHNVYAYYSGILDAHAFQTKMRYLSPHCWDVIETKSLTQGMQNAMRDLQKGQVRDDEYIQNGIDQILYECVEKKNKSKKN